MCSTALGWPAAALQNLSFKKYNINIEMPYHIEKSGRGYYVVTTSTGRKHSEKPISKAKAEAQLRVLESVKEKKKK
jgi:hypothetical protein